MFLGGLLSTIGRGISGQLDQAAYNEIGGPLLGPILGNQQAPPLPQSGGQIPAPTGGPSLLAAPVSMDSAIGVAPPQQQQSAASPYPAGGWQPTPDQQKAMHHNFLTALVSNLGTALKGGDVAGGWRQYQSDMLGQLVAQHQAIQAAQQQQRMQQAAAGFSADMQAAGQDPEKQRLALNKWGPYVGSDMLKAYGDIAKDYRAKPDEVLKTEPGPPDANGNRTLLTLYKSGAVKNTGIPIQNEIGIAGNTVFNKDSGWTAPETWNVNGKSQLIQRNIFNGQVRDAETQKAIDTPPGSIQPWVNPKDRTSPITPMEVALQAAGGDPIKAMEIYKQKGMGGANTTTLNLSPDALTTAAMVYLNKGTIPNLGRDPNGALHQAVMNRAAELGGAANITERAGDVAAQQGALKKQTEMQAAVQGFENTALNSLKLVEQGAPQIDRSGSPLFNRWKQAAQQEIAQDPNLKTFQNNIATFAGEYAKIMSGSTGGTPASDSARHEAMTRISAADSPATLSAVIAQMRQEMAGRRQGLADNVAAIRQQLMNTTAAPGMGGQQVTPPPVAGKNPFR